MKFRKLLLAVHKADLVPVCISEKRKIEWLKCVNLYFNFTSKLIFNLSSYTNYALKYACV